MCFSIIVLSRHQAILSIFLMCQSKHAMAGLAIKPGLFGLMVEQLEKRSVEFHEDGSVKVPGDERT
jgi:hypothetical protein